MGLSGTLDSFSLAEILGLIERARQTGALEVNGPEDHGTLFVSAGRFVGGEAGDFSGPVEHRAALDVRLIDVCFLLFRLDGGAFQFVPNRAPSWTADRATDIGPIVTMVEEIVREWPVVERVVPSLEAQPRVADDIEEDSLTLTRAAFRVLTAIDGRTTIRQIARENGLSVVEVCYVLKDLVEHGAVHVAAESRTRGPDPSDVVLAPGALHTLREGPSGDSDGPVEMISSVPDPDTPIDREALERQRTRLAARAGLSDPGPVPSPEPDQAPAEPAGETAEEAEPAAEAPRTEVAADRGAILRLFSGLRDQG